MKKISYLPLAALLVANTISYIGNALALVAIPWFVIETTGSALQTGLTGFFAALPLVLAGLFGGTIVDRLGYKTTSVVADVVSGIAVVLIPVLFVSVGLQFWQLLGLVFLGGLLDVPGGSARESLIPELAATSDISLERANAAFDMTRRLSTLIGAPLAGVLIAAFGVETLLWLNALSFGVSALLIALAVPAFTKVATSERQSYLIELREGLQFLRHEQLLSALIVTFALINLIGAPFYAVILPVYASQVYNSAIALGVMTASTAVGGLVGALLFGAIGSMLSKRMILVAVALFTALRYATLAMLPPLSVSILVLAAAGLMFGPLNPMTSTLVQERTPLLMRGRIFGFLEALTSASIPVGMLLGGYLLEIFGLQTVLFMQAALSLALGINVLLQKVFRTMDSRGSTSPVS